MNCCIFCVTGYDKVNDKTASKFVAKELDTSDDVTRTVWATYDRKIKGWVPLR